MRDDRIEFVDAVRVLLIEDDPLDSRTIMAALNRCKGKTFEIHSIRHAKDVATALDNDHFDVIILDLNLPDTTGLVTLARVAESAPGIAIIVLSGQDDHQIAQESLVAGAQIYQKKHELSANGLAERIEFAISRKRTELSLARAHFERQIRLPF